jgi:hypothetical protein
MFRFCEHFFGLLYAIESSSCHPDSMTATDEIVWKVSGVKQLACDRLSNKSRTNKFRRLGRSDRMVRWWRCCGAMRDDRDDRPQHVFVTFFRLLTSNPFWLIRVATRRG